MNDGGQAFPLTGMQTIKGQNVQYAHSVGMSLRDYFAAAALQGVLAGRVKWPSADEAKRVCAEDCYEIADAMLAAREAK